MGFFSKKITTNKINEALVEFFNAGYAPLLINLKDLLEDGQKSLTSEQGKELMVVPVFAVIKAVLVAFGDTPQTKKILGKFQHDIFSKYFKDEDEKNKFSEIFWKRCDEYSKILNLENKDLDIQFGQIFCSHFFGKEEDGSHLAIMMLVGGMFIGVMIETKKFLDETLSRYEVV